MYSVDSKASGSWQAKCDGGCHGIFCMKDEQGSFPRPVWTVVMAIVGIALIIICALCLSGSIPRTMSGSLVRELFIVMVLGALLGIFGCILTGVHINIRIYRI